MLDFPSAFAGTATIAALFGLGLFIYPWLLRHRGGVAAIGAVTFMLTYVFYVFDRSYDAPIGPSWLLALAWALAPAGVGAIVHRLSRRPAAD